MILFVGIGKKALSRSQWTNRFTIPARTMMEPMKPMKPMKPMEPMKPATPWWPDDLGQPDTSGAQNDLRYAYFASRHRLAVSRGGKATVYDTGEYEVRGVQQQQGGEGADLTFSSQNGEVPLSRLKLVNS
jgi:hypothetical protein